MKTPRKIWKEVRESTKDFLHKASLEVHETKEAGLVLKKYAKGNSLSKEEKKLVKLQIFDILKGVGIAIPLALVPGAGILLPILIRTARKHKIDLLPSSFK